MCCARCPQHGRVPSALDSISRRADSDDGEAKRGDWMMPQTREHNGHWLRECMHEAKGQSTAADCCCQSPPTSSRKRLPESRGRPSIKRGETAAADALEQCPLCRYLEPVAQGTGGATRLRTWIITSAAHVRVKRKLGK